MDVHPKWSTTLQLPVPQFSLLQDLSHFLSFTSSLILIDSDHHQFFKANHDPIDPN